MTVPNLKLWRKEADAYVSPRFPHHGEFDRVRKFFIRSTIAIETDDKNLIIRLITDEKKAKGNMEKIERLGLLK